MQTKRIVWHLAAFAFLSSLSAHGLPAQTVVGAMGLLQTGHRDEAISSLIAISNSGGIEGDYATCSMHFYGLGKANNFSIAFKYCKNAAEAGQSDAQFVVGSLYENGAGVALDLLKAASWYMKSLKQGNLYAGHNLGVMYYE